MTRAPVDALLIGHVTHDFLPDGVDTIGGTVAYAALTLAAFGLDVGLVTLAAPDFDLARLADAVQVLRHPAPVTTTFTNLDTPAGRAQYVRAMAPAVLPEHIPAVWRSAPLVHIGPVVDARAPGLVELFAGRAFVGLTPQGWMRRVDCEGRVHPQAWADADALLPQTSAVVVSLEDLAGDWARAEAWAAQTPLLVVTEGRRGGVLFEAGRRVAFRAFPVPEVDTTGAGDIFAAAFFYAVAEGTSPARAATFAACVAGHSVRRVGLDSVPTRAELLACREECERGVK